MTKDLQASGTGITSIGQYVQPRLGSGMEGEGTIKQKLICEGELLLLFFKMLAVINR